MRCTPEPIHGPKGTIGDATRFGWARHRLAVGRVQEDRSEGAARSADRALRPRGQVRGRPRVGRTAPPRRRGRPRQLRDHRADRRHRAVRAGAQHQVRDLRRAPDQGCDHRRAALHRLGAPLRPGQGPGRRAVVLQARGHPPPDAHRRGGGGRPRDDRPRSSRPPSARSPSWAWSRSTRSSGAATTPTGRRWARPCRTPPPARWTPSRSRRPRRPSSRRWARWPSGRRRSSPSTTTRVSPSPRSATSSG